MSSLRVIAIAVFRRRDEILVSPVPDDVKGITGWRSPGGGVEFGEHSADALRREVREEMGLEIAPPRLLATLENVFTFLGKPGHEVVFVYEATFIDPSLYERERFECVEANSAPFVCVWRSLRSFGPASPLYPEPLLALLR